MADQRATAAIPIPGGAITLALTATGLDAAIQHLELIALRMRDQAPAWRVIGDHLRAGNASRWGQGWPARKKDPGWPMLRHTGELFGAVTGPGAVRTHATGLEYVLASGKPIWHQYGTSRGLPARPMVKFGGDDVGFAVRTLRAFVFGGNAGGVGPWGAG